MGEMKKVARAFVPGVRAVERKLQESAVEAEEFEADLEHRSHVRRFERRTDEALAEGRALAAEYNLEQMKQALSAAKSGKLLGAAQAHGALAAPGASVFIEGQAQDTPGGSVAASVTAQDIEELAMRFARKAQGIADQAEVQGLFRNWSRELRQAMPEFQAVEVERKARSLINSYS